MAGQGQAATHFISPVFEWAQNDDAMIPEADQDRAIELLEQAGYSTDGSGESLEVTIDVFDSGAFLDMATVIQDQLSQIGVSLSINSMEYAAWQEKLIQIVTINLV
ncbi:hypothetical protein JCM19055_226 [Geomicrobium sp. JCM 19055]|nr:hypothetical protein JCM19055_226 [Geomicrobium sp. JCM 19055]